MLRFLVVVRLGWRAEVVGTRLYRLCSRGDVVVRGVGVERRVALPMVRALRLGTLTLRDARPLAVPLLRLTPVLGVVVVFP